MANKRKYPKVQGWWVYSIQIKSNGKYYIGVSKLQCSQRWKKCNYKDKSLAPYLNEWDSMIKTVLIDGLTKDEAYQYEDNIIRALQMNNLCINKQRSGLIASDKNAYQRELYQNNGEYREREIQRVKQWREDNREQYNEYQREYQKQYYERNKESINNKRRQRRLKKQQQQTSVH